MGWTHRHHKSPLLQRDCVIFVEGNAPSSIPGSAIKGTQCNRRVQRQNAFKTQPKCSKREHHGFYSSAVLLGSKAAIPQALLRPGSLCQDFELPTNLPGPGCFLWTQPGIAIAISEQLAFLCSSSKRDLSNRERAQALKASTRHSSSSHTQGCHLCSQPWHLPQHCHRDTEISRGEMFLPGMGMVSTALQETPGTQSQISGHRAMAVTGDLSG